MAPKRCATGSIAAEGFRVELDDRQEKIGLKIREAQLQKIPYMLVVGDREDRARAPWRSGAAPPGIRGRARLDDLVLALHAEVRAKRIGGSGGGAQTG